MQGLEQNTVAVVPGGAQPIEKSVIKSQTWNKNREKFLKGEPKVLGVIQVMIALINLSLGTIILTNIFSEPVISVILLAPIWGPIMFIVSGSLSIVAGVETTKGLVISSLSLNIISSVLAAIASIICVVSLLVASYSPIHNNITKGLDALMLILNMLEFCIAVSISVFGCKASCCNSSESLFSCLNSVHGVDWAVVSQKLSVCAHMAIVLTQGLLQMFLNKEKKHIIEETPNPAVRVMASPMTLQPLLPSEHQGKNVPENVYKNHPGEIV